jgi:hypothetical protein
MTYALQFLDDPAGDVLSTVFYAWEDGAWTYLSGPAEWVGGAIRLTFLRTDLPFASDGLAVRVWSGRNWEWRDYAEMAGTLPAPAAPLMRDFSHEIDPGRGGPLMEAFTLPELLPYQVHAAVAAATDDPRLDGLAIYQTFRTDIVFFAGAYSTVGNAGADGIGAGTSAEPESPALLHMNQIRYGWNSWDEGKITVLNHEYGHHWLYFFAIDEGGTIGYPLNPGRGHPAGWVHAPAAVPVLRADDASCMGGSTWTDHADGTFTSAPAFVSHGYAWHELYLMGLADPLEVDDWWYLKNADPPLPAAYWPPADMTVTAERVPVVIDQVIAAEGPRVPAHPDTRSSFVVPLVLVTRPGEETRADVDEVHHTCEVWRAAFRQATIGRGEVTCDRLGNRPPEATILVPGADVQVPEGTTLSFVGEGRDPDLDAVTLTWSFDGLAPDASGPGPHPITFGARGRYDVRLRAVDATGLEDLIPAEVTIRVTCAPPPALDALRVRREGPDALQLTWTDAVPRSDEAFVVASGVPSGGFVETASTWASGRLGLTVPLPVAWEFYRVRGRNLPDCVGP